MNLCDIIGIGVGIMKKIEIDNIVINYSDSLEHLAINTIELLKNKIGEYKQLFGINDLETVTANYFDNLDEFREFIYKLRGERKSLPEYARGTYDNGMINSCVDAEKQMNKLYTASHELFHILYMKHVLKGNYQDRIVWYDEGMAQYFSGENRRLDSEEEFQKFYFRVKESTKLIPKLNELEHGSSFCNEKYNGYNLSYLSIKYLSETLSEEEFKNLMPDFSRIKDIGVNVLDSMFEYFDKKYESKKMK